MKKHLFTYVMIIILILTALSIMLIQVAQNGREESQNSIKNKETMSVSVDSIIPDTDSNDSMEEGESNSYNFIELNGISGSIKF